MFCFFEAVPLEAVCPDRFTPILWLYKYLNESLLFSLQSHTPCLPGVHSTPGFPLQLSLPLSDTTRLHTACSSSQFSLQYGMGLLCCRPFLLAKAGHLHRLHPFPHPGTHPQLFGEIMQHIHWHSVSIGNNLKINALFPHKEKGKASEKYTIIILTELVQ